MCVRASSIVNKNTLFFISSYTTSTAMNEIDAYSQVRLWWRSNKFSKYLWFSTIII